MLGVGMAVDANILMYERIREELRVGKSVKTSFMAGAKSAFTAILDANITTILAAVVLFIFGTSSVKGFATSAYHQYSSQLLDSCMGITSPVRASG